MGLLRKIKVLLKSLKSAPSKDEVFHIDLRIDDEINRYWKRLARGESEKSARVNFDYAISKKSSIPKSKRRKGKLYIKITLPNKLYRYTKDLDIEIFDTYMVIKVSDINYEQNVEYGFTIDSSKAEVKLSNGEIWIVAP